MIKSETHRVLNYVALMQAFFFGVLLSSYSFATPQCRLLEYYASDERVAATPNSPNPSRLDRVRNELARISPEIRDVRIEIVTSGEPLVWEPNSGEAFLSEGELRIMVLRRGRWSPLGGLIFHYLIEGQTIRMGYLRVPSRYRNIGISSVLTQYLIEAAPSSLTNFPANFVELNHALLIESVIGGGNGNSQQTRAQQYLRSRIAERATNHLFLNEIRSLRGGDDVQRFRESLVRAITEQTPAGRTRTQVGFANLKTIKIEYSNERTGPEFSADFARGPRIDGPPRVIFIDRSTSPPTQVELRADGSLLRTTELEPLFE